MFSYTVQVVVDANRTEELLPVRSFVFLGVPHRGLEVTALKTLVQGTSSERMINELQEGSSVLEILDHDFEENFRRSPVRILTCYESSPTPTVKMVAKVLHIKREVSLISFSSLLMAPLNVMDHQ